MNRLRWMLKQLVPCFYVSKFIEDGRRRLCIWRMWLGRCFAVRYYDLKD